MSGAFNGGRSVKERRTVNGASNGQGGAFRSVRNEIDVKNSCTLRLIYLYTYLMVFPHYYYQFFTDWDEKGFVGTARMRATK